MTCYLLALLVGLLTGPIAVSSTLTCTSAYQARSSTLCLTDSDFFSTGTGGVTAAEKQTIIDVHNTFRNDVSPTSSSMVKAVWDDNLADMAQKWAQQCKVEHDSDSARYIIEYYDSPGQNGGFGYADWTTTITEWHSEVNNFTYGTGGGGNVVGHYTQVVQGGVAKIGCGYAYCTDTGSYSKYYFCNYFVANEDVVTPYTQGSSCGDCSAKCSGKLCDCGGKYCFNDGTLDLNTCTCTCTGTIFSGDQCLTKLCPPADDLTCDPTIDCDYFTQYKETCPFICNICEESEATPCDQHPKCHQSTLGCTYMGDQFSSTVCDTYGVDGQDSQSCESQGGSWGCNYCKEFSNVPADYCPKMCAICPE